MVTVTRPDREAFLDYFERGNENFREDLQEMVFLVCGAISASMEERDNPLESLHRRHLGWLTTELDWVEKAQMEKTGETEASYRARQYVMWMMIDLSYACRPDNDFSPPRVDFNRYTHWATGGGDNGK